LVTHHATNRRTTRGENRCAAPPERIAPRGGPMVAPDRDGHQAGAAGGL